MPTRNPFGDSRRSSKITLAVGIGGLFAFTLLMDCLPDSHGKPATDDGRLDACAAWKRARSQGVAGFLKAFDDQGPVVEDCLRAAHRAEALRALRKRHSSSMAPE